MTAERPADGADVVTLARIRHQAVLLESLAQALIRQRGAVAKDRVDEVHATVDELQHILHSLAVSRREAGTAAAADASPEMAEALVALRKAAVAARREAAINRDVLDRGREAGERFLQDWFSRVDAPDGYGPAEARRTAGGRIVDRRG